MCKKSDQLRITFVLPYAGFAGGIRVIAIYAQRLQQRGHRVVVISTPWTPPGRRARAVFMLKKWLQRLGAPVEPQVRPSHMQSVEVEHIQIAENRPINNDDVPDGDVVIATWWETAHWVAALSPSKGAKAYFVQDYGAPGQPLEQVARTWLFPMHKLVISRWLVGLISQYCDDADVDYVPNAVDLKQFNAAPRMKQAQPTVGFLFNPAPQKGCDTIRSAIELARKSISNLRVMAYGPGDPDVDMPLPEGTEYWQYAPDDKLREIYAACDAWLFGSRREGFGLPILEAMACRTPVIGTPAGAAPELLAEGGGLLVRPNDPRDMARAIIQVNAMDQLQWQTMSDAAYATARRFTWDHATDRFEAGLLRAIAKGSAHKLTAA